MPTLSNSHDQYFQMLETLVYNPGRKFITAADESNAINQAAITVAGKLGGIWYNFPVAVLAANQTDFIIPDNTIMRIRYAEIIDNNTGQVVDFFDVVSYEQFRVINFQQQSDNYFAYYEPSSQLLHIQPGVPLTTYTVRLLCYGFPNLLVQNSAVLYDGDIGQMSAICKEAASLLRIKTRDMEESTGLHNKALEAVDDAAVMQSQSRRVGRIQVGRHTPLSRMKRF